MSQQDLISAKKEVRDAVAKAETLAAEALKAQQYAEEAMGRLAEMKAEIRRDRKAVSAAKAREEEKKDETELATGDAIVKSDKEEVAEPASEAHPEAPIETETEIKTDDVKIVAEDGVGDMATTETKQGSESQAQ
mmetsp:Transcript_37872/g.77264  ORF Transcript_37872/g.77264 Transcript_37872/m.77264 type:complete len:135 (-) Transcript_37872:365-769(-)|eukprot:CAMPEP_0183293224 /NCGR_PEP_ID=MMETSP0160_2-20130417/1992_1 /TAXON_ID=2839 ORGANISM="Odontella Sinensis, Strain Grunow 1884" /NCGR_SAMPLE_ID=MMETSP0160_2 /ASSEMBLY_ACC=CAM_ASM_000250 /LENGTH=134 /DNA_ID=CAMNT_0025454307 /DNA_START=82 /DNA_END=486 /DNA_ORIENTATION=+